MFIKKQTAKQIVNINNNNEFRGKIKTKSKKRNSSSGHGFYYSFLTIVLLLCLVQITISAVLNISKVVSYKAKIVQMTNNRDAALALNDQLKDNIKNFSNVNGLEAIARNNLKMSGEDEVLIIINSPNGENGTEETRKNKFTKFFNKAKH